MSVEGVTNSVTSRRQRGRAIAVAASVMVTVVALAGCGAAEPQATATATSSPTSTESDPTPLPTAEPLIVPGCETLLPLAAAKDLFAPDTEVLGDEEAIPVRGDELPEIDTAASNGTIAKNCIWGVPNSDGVFSLAVTDISDTDAANLKAALLSAGYIGVTTDGVTMLEFSTEADVGTRASTHYLVADLWIFVSGTSLSLTNGVAGSALDEVRLANPTRTY